MQSHRRLGRRDDDRSSRRAILVTLAGKSMRDDSLETTNQLRNGGGDYSKICIKKDVHPSSRKGWKRLHHAERVEYERPENAGCVVRLDALGEKIVPGRSNDRLLESSVFLDGPQQASFLSILL